MKVQQLYQNRQTSNLQTGQSLKQGQVIGGNILKIFPNKRAEIQLGSRQMVAQLEASIAVGKSYHFQVLRKEDNVVHLKVLSEQIADDSRANIKELIRRIGLKPTRQQISFIQSIINERIPFQPAKIPTAVHLLNGASNKEMAQQVLKQMFVNRLPINEAVFQALYVNKTENLLNLINSLSQTAHQDHLSPLLSSLQGLIESTSTNDQLVVRSVLANAQHANPKFINPMQASGIIEPYRQIEESEGLLNRTQSLDQQHGSQQSHQVKRFIQNLLQNRDVLVTESQAIIQKWTHLLIRPQTNTITDFAPFKQGINDRIAPLLTNEQQQQWEKLIESKNIAMLSRLLTLFASEETYMLANKLDTFINYEFPKQQFLFQLRQMIHETGLFHENLLALGNEEEQSSSVKSMLMQFIQQHEGVNQERAQQLLHFINGLQIQSVQDSEHFIQASIQIPGKKLALHNDLYLDFESKKTPDGKINPDFCRILFYLDLAHLNETVIDMNIQKRLVTITVYNEEAENLYPFANQVKPMLIQGLQSLQYDLTTITFKHLQHETKHETCSQTRTKQDAYEGIDFRI